MQPFHISAYVFKADIVCCDCIAEWAMNELIQEGSNKPDVEVLIRNVGLGYDAGVYAYRSEIILRQLAGNRGIDLENEYSWDSDDFPKVVFADMVEDKENCGTCHKEIP